MASLTFGGTRGNGQSRVTDNVTLSEQSKDYAVIANLDQAPQARVRSPRLTHHQQAADFAKQIIEVSAHVE
jgi:hypothetical protein